MVKSIRSPVPHGCCKNQMKQLYTNVRLVIAELLPHSNKYSMKEKKKREKGNKREREKTKKKKKTTKKIQ